MRPHVDIMGAGERMFDAKERLLPEKSLFQHDKIAKAVVYHSISMYILFFAEVTWKR